MKLHSDCMTLVSSCLMVYSVIWIKQQLFNKVHTNYLANLARKN